MKYTSDSERLSYLRSLVEVLPELPGVYQYFNENDKIIYVGKAKNLKRRVSSYFMNKNHNLKTRILVSKICNIKHIVVNSENDAFILENNLIKKLQPHYNILLKDGKTYPWIVIKNEPFPRVFLTRNVVRDGSYYYGPYSSITQVRAILDMLKKLYPIRNCSLDLSREKIWQAKYKVCLNYHIKNCCGPCIGEIDSDTYNSYIADIKDVLRGNSLAVIRAYKQQMFDYAEALEFEKAQEIKKKVDVLSNYQSRSTVSVNSALTVDVFSFVRNSPSDAASDNRSSTCFVNFIKVVNGSTINSFTMEFKNHLDEEPAEILSYAIEEVRERVGVIAREVVVPFLPDVQFDNVKFTIPQSGDKKSLLELSEKNARMYKLELVKQEGIKNNDSREERLMQTIKECLDLKSLPHHIECFDNSNIQGTNAVAACVVYRDCKPSKDEYRKFNIKTVEGPDDYASMYEVVYRRYSRLKEEGKEMPDIIIADGGIGQMEVIRQATEDALGLHITIMGLVKDNKHRTRELLLGFPPKTIGIGKNDQIFKFFTRVQDEVHRFAITFHRDKRSKSMLQSSLDLINGIGPKTKESLLNTFKSVANIEKQDLPSLIAAIGQSKGKIVYDYFHVPRGTDS